MAELRPHREVWRYLLAIAWPLRRRFLLVAVLALFATGTDLIEPLIYRAAVNDIAGLFVGTPGERGVDSLIDSEEVQAVAVPDTPVMESHERGRVAARTPAQTFNTLMWAVALLFLVAIVSHWFSLAADQQTAILASKLESGVILKTFAHVLRLPLAYFSRRPSAGLAKQIDQLDQVAPIVTAIAQQVGPETLRMFGVLVIMATQSWRLTLVALITLPPYLWVVRRSAARLESGLGSYYEMWEGVSTRIQGALSAIKTVKLSGAEQRETDRLGVDANAAYERYVQRNKLGNRYVFWQTLLSYLSRTLVLGYGGWLVLERQLTPGDVVMFVVYLDKMYAPLETLTGLGVRLQEHVASLRRAVRLLKTGGEESGGSSLAPGPGHVELRDVRFAYTPQREILQGVNIELAAGKVTALVGPSGAGKTTAVDLLLRLFEPSAGQVMIDGQALSGLDPSSVRREIGVVSADGSVFRGSINDNIRYKRPDASDADVQAAIAAAGLGATIDRLPDGFATEVGEGGVGLSLGERQRVQIARALLARPRVLILDEATANLDYETETEIRRTLLHRPERPTTLVIAHRYSMARDADYVYVLNEGRVVEHGVPVELAAAGGWFAEFARSAEGRDAHPG